MADQMTPAQAIQVIVDCFYSKTCVGCPLGSVCSEDSGCDTAMRVLRALNVEGLMQAEQAYKQLV